MSYYLDRIQHECPQLLKVRFRILGSMDVTTNEVDWSIVFSDEEEGASLSINELTHCPRCGEPLASRLPDDLTAFLGGKE